MARGKHAALAANRRYETAMEHIGRLTDELAETKIRMRNAEARATVLERSRDSTAKGVAKNDELLTATLDKLKWWDRIAKEDYDRRYKAIREMFFDLWRDITPGFADDAPVEDRRQFFAKRYPDLMLALTAGGTSIVSPEPDQARPVKGDRLAMEPMRKMDPERLRHFQRLCGQRSIWEGDVGRDMADVIIDLLDAKQAGFSDEEIREFVLPDAVAT